MKTFLIPLAAAILLATAPPPARAQGSISVDFFYDNLSSQGAWLDVGDYGYVWQPNDIYEDWSPYSDGRWVYTEAGWTWDSNEPYGWAVYHYGRWANVSHVGWVWVPGTEWGPAWVSWRHSQNYVGWAPLPPEARFSASIGFSSWVDDYYDIGPGNYRFVEGRNFGSRNLNRSFVDRRQNITIINETTNITNITYQNNVIHNGGPVYEDQMRLSSEPISRYKLDRRQRFEGDPRNQTPDQLRSRVEGDSFIVAAPNLVEGGARAPGKLAKTVRDAEVDRGWKDAGSPEEVAAMRAERRAKAKSEVPAGLPKEPKFERPAARPSAETPGSVESREKGKGGTETEVDPTAPRPMTPATDGPGNSRPDPSGGRPERSDEKGKGKGKGPNAENQGKPSPPRPMPPATDGPGNTKPDPGNRPERPDEKGKGKGSNPDKQGQPSPPRPMAPVTDGPGNTKPDQGSRPERPDEKGKGSNPETSGRPPSPRPPSPGSESGKEKAERPNAPQVPNPGKPETGASDRERRNPGSQATSPQSRPQGSTRMPVEREPGPGGPAGAKEKGKGIPESAPPPRNPKAKPEKDDEQEQQN